MLSYFDIGASVAQPMQAEVAQAGQDAVALQQQRHLAVAPRLNLRSAVEAAGVRQRAQADFGLGERRLGLEGQRIGMEDRRLGLLSREADLKIGQTNYERSMLPYTIGLGAVAGGMGLYRGYRDLTQGQKTEDMLRQDMAIRQQMGREGVEATKQQVSLWQAVKDQYNRQYGPKPSSSDLYEPQ